MLGLCPLKKGKMMNEFISVCKFLLVNPATSASGERLFSTALRVENMASQQSRKSDLAT